MPEQVKVASSLPFQVHCGRSQETLMSQTEMATCNNEEAEEIKKPIFRDIRRYYCQYCGICRSKKSIIRSHVLTQHTDKVNDHEGNKIDSETEVGNKLQYICEDCGAKFRKPAHLKQHMQGHSLEAYRFLSDYVGVQTRSMKCEALDPIYRTPKCKERPFTCPVEDCYLSYRRKDHLNRHLLKHEGKLFDCPIKNCNKRFAFQGNMTRHAKEMHDEAFEGKKQHVCLEAGCGKTFKHASRLRKHEDSHVKLDYSEVICGEPGCLKKFSNFDCLKAHRQACHQYVLCETCGTQQLKKNIKRHIRIHEGCSGAERIKCSFQGCQYTFSKTSNLKKHVKAVHEELRPFPCRISGCGQKFPYKHVRDNHEGRHVHVLGDFVEADEQWRSRPRGGRKRKNVSVDMLMRKRVAPLSQDSMLHSPNNHGSVLNDGTSYLRWLLSGDE